MDPQNIIDMNAAVSGVSATMGAPESLHRQFRMDPAQGQIRANMALRLVKRAAQKKVHHYDPKTPKTSSKKHPLTPLSTEQALSRPHPKKLLNNSKMPTPTYNKSPITTKTIPLTL